MHRYNDFYVPVSAIKLIVYSTAVLTVLLEALLLTYSSEIEDYQPLILGSGFVAVLYMAIATALVYRSRYIHAGIMLIIFFYSVSVASLANLGAGYSAGLMTMGFVIFLAGAVTKAQYTIIATLVCVSTLFTIHHLHTQGTILPASDTFKPGPGDLITYACLLAIFGLISQMVAAYIRKGFQQAEKARQDLKKQNDGLQKLLRQERQKLKKAHMEETRQLYQFAEIGQSTVATLHELSNQLGVLNFDIEDLSDNSPRGIAIENIKESVKQINTLIIATRKRLRSRRTLEKFDLIKLIRQTVDENTCNQWSKSSAIELYIPSGLKAVPIRGDPVDLAQVVSIIVRNACDASTGPTKTKVSISLELNGNNALLSIQDDGPGIPQSIRNNIFRPINSTKSDGLGIGLYIAKHIISSQFKGSLKLTNDRRTTFIIKLPLTK